VADGFAVCRRRVRGIRWGRPTRKMPHEELWSEGRGDCRGTE
jgi:hypothetical protein